MARVYNSAVVNEIKSVKESIEERYSSNQLINVLDDILEHGLKILIERTSFIDMMSASCLTWYSGNSRRKISSLDKHRVMYLLALYPVLDDAKDKLKIVRRLRLERNIRFFLLKTFMERAQAYTKLEIEASQEPDFERKSRALAKMHRLQHSLGVRGSMSAVGHQVEFWYALALKFRNQIMEKYMRHTVMSATRYYQTDPDRLDLEDLVQNFQVALNKAINKFDQRKGTLTSYVNQWLRNAQNPTGDVCHEYGTAYSIPAAVKRGMAAGTSSNPVNIYVTIEDGSAAMEVACDRLTPEQMIERDSDIDRVRRLAKIADPLGVARLRLGIEERLSTQELRQLHSASSVNS